MKHRLIITAAAAILFLTGGCGTNGKSEAASHSDKEFIYVSASADAARADGSETHPFQTIQDAVDVSYPGAEIIIEEGRYKPFEVMEECSGTKADRTIIEAAEGAYPVIEVPCGGAAEESVGIRMENVSDISICGLEVAGGTHGIYYESNAGAAGESLGGITIRGCRVHDIDGVHGIAVYAANDRIPVTEVVIEECEVAHCRCGDSESLVLNGNIDGFEIRNNTVHDNDNIGIDMIGFEGTAVHDDSYEGNCYDADFVRNGKCYGNTVCRITAEGNEAYLENGEYTLGAGGIYVDGGQNIDIYENKVTDCDIGIEVATEHNPKENQLFQTAGINVYENRIAACSGYAGLCFGGYDAEQGFTVDCHFYRNTLIHNPVQIAVQRSRNNEIDYNTIIGGETIILYNESLPEQERENNFHDNIQKAELPSEQENARAVFFVKYQQ